MVKLTDIVPSGTNNLQREAWELKPDALKELAESIQAKGVISPVLLRPDGKPGKFYLVCGERRFQASKIAGREDIPAFIREISDEEAFDLQITENLQRKDVHPLKEAQAYKALMDADRVKNSVQELSKRFGKPVEYITHRLAFNNLIPEMKKEFFEGKMLIGHAILFSRLTEQDQKECLKICKQQYGVDPGGYISLKSAQANIDQKLIRNLHKATFNMHDANLVVSAGSCDTCPKRSGHNTLLFSDVKDKDRCFDGACFELKTSRYLITKLDEYLSDDPEMPVISGWSEQLEGNLKKHLEKSGIKVLREYNDYNESKKGEKGAVRAFAVAGNKIGQLVWIQKRKSVSGSSSTPKAKPAKNSPAAIDDQIKKLREDLKLEKETMDEKIAQAIVDRLTDLKPYREPDSTPLTSYEIAALVRSISYSSLSDKKVTEALKKIKVDEKLSKDQQQIEKLSKLPEAVRNYIFRQYIADDWGSYMDGSETYAIRKIAGQFKGMNVKAIEDQFVVDYNKKEIDTNKKIKDLQEKKKNLQPGAKANSKK